MRAGEGQIKDVIAAFFSVAALKYRTNSALVHLDVLQFILHVVFFFFKYQTRMLIFTLWKLKKVITLLKPAMEITVKLLSQTQYKKDSVCCCVCDEKLC